MVRESLSQYIHNNFQSKEQADLMLEEDDEKVILNILANEKFTSYSDFKHKFNL